MVAQTVRKANAPFRGVRPLNPARDMRQVALLLQEAFGDDLAAMHGWARVPFLREVGAALISTTFLPMSSDMLRGFVWEEDHRILGNVTLTLDDRASRRWLISNVAVAATHRRRGIARQLMEAALDEARSRGARWIILNVRPYNTAAIHLYQSLGFDTVDTETTYVYSGGRSHQTAAPLMLRQLGQEESQKAYDLALNALGEPLRTFRPPPLADFGLSLEDRLAERVVDLFIFQSTERWGYFEDRELLGTVLIRAQRLAPTHTVDIRVAPSRRGIIEKGLVSAALARLAHFPPRQIETKVLASSGALVEALTAVGFAPTHGLTMMARELKS